MGFLKEVGLPGYGGECPNQLIWPVSISKHSAMKACVLSFGIVIQYLQRRLFSAISSVTRGKGQEKDDDVPGRHFSL